MKDYELAMLLDEDLQDDYGSDYTGMMRGDYGHDHSGSANVLKTGGLVLAGILLGVGGAIAFNKVRGSGARVPGFYTYDIHTLNDGSQIIRIIKRRIGMLIDTSANWVGNPQFETAEQALQAGMAIAPNAIYKPSLNNYSSLFG
jgi:hypothetical protein